MTPRKAAAGKTARATNARNTAKKAAAPRVAAKSAGGASEEWFVGPYGDLISRAEYIALMKRAGEAMEAEGE